MVQPSLPIVSGMILAVGISPAVAASPLPPETSSRIEYSAAACAECLAPHSPKAEIEPFSDREAWRSPTEHLPEFSTTQATDSGNPVDDRFLQDLPIPPPPTAEPVLSPPEAESSPVDEEAPAATESTPAADELRFFVQTIEVLGSTVFDAVDLAPITQPLENREVTLAELQAASDAITQLYLDDGYLTSRALLVDQEVTNGVVQIQVIEGSVAAIEILGLQRLNERYVRDRIQLGADVPLKAEDLEEQLRLLRFNPLFETVEASLRPSGIVGQSILVVRVTEADPWFGGFSVDNYSPPSVGSERMNASLGYRNLTGLGDELSATYRRTTTGGAEIAEFSYQVPLNPMDGTLQLRSTLDWNTITGSEFEGLNISGESEFYEISFRQPLIRSVEEEFALSLGLSHSDGQTFLFNSPTPFGIGPDPDGVSRVTALRFGQDYVRRDQNGAWAVRSLFSVGLDLLDPTINDHPIPDGRFLSWLFQAQRVQRLSEDHLLIALLDLQLTPDSLLPSEQFVIGGGQFLRGYVQNARSGDNGFRFSLEDRMTLARNESATPVFQLAPFFDVGAVWNHPDNPNELPDQTFLASIGLAALWEPLPGFNIRLDYAFPFVILDDRGQNAQDGGFYFSAGYQF
jgi:hemolysin activation/secretion protein